MSPKFTKYLNIGLWIVIGIIILLLVNLLSSLDDPAKLDASLNANFYWCYFLLAIVVVLMLSFSVYLSFTSGKSEKKSLIQVSGLLAVFLVAYMMSSSEMPKFFGAAKLIEAGTLTPTVSKLVDTGLYSVYILFAISIVALIYSSVRFSK